MDISNTAPHINGCDLVAVMDSIKEDISWHKEQIAERKRENKVTEIYEEGLAELEAELAPMTALEEDLIFFDLDSTLFINADKFEDYCCRFAIECGEISENSPVLAYVNWGRYADTMRIDYKSIMYGDEEYLYHS